MASAMIGSADEPAGILSIAAPWIPPRSLMCRPVRRVHRKGRTHLSLGLVHLVLSDVQVRQVEAHGRGVGKERNRLTVVVDRA